MGGRTRGRLEQDPTEFTRLARRACAPVYLLHVTRNPYDIIARWVLTSKDGRTVAEVIDNFARNVRTIDDTVIAKSDGPVLTLRHEALVSSLRTELARACGFLGVDTDDAYLDDCASIAFPAPQTARHRVEWTPADRDSVQQIIDRHAFLAGYSWTSSI